ncbi:unnamed protein product [Arabidopsis halleri]
MEFTIPLLKLDFVPPPIAIMVVRPRIPEYTIQDAKLNVDGLNLNLMISSTLENRNKHIFLRSENGGSANVYYNHFLLSRQLLEPFNLAAQEKNLDTMSFFTTIPENKLSLQQQIQKEMQNNTFKLKIETNFKLKARWASLHYAFVLHGRCNLQMSSNGFPIKKLNVGSCDWVEDPEVAWIDGEVIEVKGNDIKVKCTSGKTVAIKISNAYPKDVEAPASGVDDMTRLAYLHEPGEY